MSQLEKHLEAKVILYAKSRGCLIYKFSSPSHAGVCDRIIIAPFGQVGFLELKRQGERPTALQQKFLDDVVKQGGNAGWVDNLADAKLFINFLIALAALS